MRLGSVLQGRAAVVAGVLGACLALIVAGFAFGALARGDASAEQPTPAATRPVTQVIPGSRTASAAPSPTASTGNEPKGPDIVAYKGLGSWVDIYDARAWADPAGAVRDMAGHGVKTLYIETSNSHSPFIIKDPEKMSVFIREAHALKIRVVAWYLPEMTDPTMDLDRIAKAIRFRTPEGQGFDSFALDIESDKIASVARRNEVMLSLSSKIRQVAGEDYPLGAIIPSPGAMSRPNGFWHEFPYSGVAAIYDVFVPMSYYTYHGDGGGAARSDTLTNMRALRAQPGAADEPVHLIGGLAEKSTPTEVRAFVAAARETGAIGASMYTWDGTTPEHWTQLAAVR